MNIKTLVYIDKILEEKETQAYEDYRDAEKSISKMEKEENIDCWRTGSGILELEREMRNIKLRKYKEIKAMREDWRSHDWH